MKRLLVMSVFAMLFAFGGSSTEAKDVWVDGYFRLNGTYVKPHYRSQADSNFWNNWSTKPNINPYTGKLGTRITPPKSYRSFSYPSFRSTWSPSFRYSPSTSSFNRWRW